MFFIMFIFFLLCFIVFLLITFFITTSSNCSLIDIISKKSVILIFDIYICFCKCIFVYRGSDFL